MNASVPVRTYAAELCGFMRLQSPVTYSVIGIVRTEVSLLGGPITILVRAPCDTLVSCSLCRVFAIRIALSFVETLSHCSAQSSPIRMPVHSASKIPNRHESRLSFLLLVVCVLGYTAPVFSRILQYFQLYLCVYFANRLYNMSIQIRRILLLFSLIAFAIYTGTIHFLRTPEWYTTYPFVFCWNN